MSSEDDVVWSGRARELAEVVGPTARAAIVVRDGKLIAQVVQHRGAPDVTALTLACPRGRDGTLYLTHAPNSHARQLAKRLGIRRIVLAHPTREATQEIAHDDAALATPAPLAS